MAGGRRDSLQHQLLGLLGAWSEGGRPGDPMDVTWGRDRHLQRAVKVVHRHRVAGHAPPRPSSEILPGGHQTSLDPPPSPPTLPLPVSKPIQPEDKKKSEKQSVSEIYSTRANGYPSVGCPSGLGEPSPPPANGKGWGKGVGKGGQLPLQCPRVPPGLGRRGGGGWGQHFASPVAHN